MARDREMTVVLSVLDRLSATIDRSSSYLASVRTLKESIRRDLEDLLNTRRAPEDEFEGYTLARGSVVNYGLRDLSSLMLSSANGAQQVQRAVERCLADFEPRLRDVRVELLRSELAAREIRLHIEATIPMQPSTEAVSFDTMLDLASGLYSVG